MTPFPGKLRAWQERAFQTVRGRYDQADTLVMATPGGGKTRLGCRVGHEQLERRRVDRMLVVCPTNHLRGQWAEAAHLCGLHLDPRLGNTQALEARDYHGAVVTYQQVAQAPGVFQRALQQRRTFVVLDEVHHAGDGKAWAQGLKQAFEAAPLRLSLSGTPFRSDNHPIPFVRYEYNVSRPDFVYRYSDALRDHVCRPIYFQTYEGDLTWKSDGQVCRATFAKALDLVQARERMKAALTLPSWMGSVLTDAHKLLYALRVQEHPEAGGLIVAMTQTHARVLADQMEVLTGSRPSVAVSDDPEASATIRAFGTSKDPWLIAVNMVSEGVDIPRLRCGVFATNVQTEMYFRQVVGRFVRVQPSLGRSQRAWLFMPHDPVLVSYAEEIQAERDHVLREQGHRFAGSDGGGMGPSGKEFEAVSGVARQQAVIGVDEPQGTLPDLPAGPTLAEQKDELRELHRTLVGQVHRKYWIGHREINLELIKRVGGRIESATLEQLRRRNKVLQGWLDHGWG